MTDRTPVPERFLDKATDKQVGFIASLLDRKDLFSCPEFFDRVNAMDSEEYLQYLAALKQQMTQVTKARASEIIDKLLALPDDTTGKHQTAAGGSVSEALPEVPAGRYAVEREGTLKFYRVDRPTEGRWAGYTFVKVQASDETYPVKGASRKAVLAAIMEAGVQASMERYGQEIGRCGVCGRTLTDETSRAIGIGPVCRAQEGW